MYQPNFSQYDITLSFASYKMNIQRYGFEETGPATLHHWYISRNSLGKRGLFTMVNIAKSNIPSIAIYYCLRIWLQQEIME